MLSYCLELLSSSSIVGLRNLIPCDLCRQLASDMQNDTLVRLGTSLMIVMRLHAIHVSEITLHRMPISRRLTDRMIVNSLVIAKDHMSRNIILQQGPGVDPSWKN